MIESNEVRELRIRLGLTQLELADLAGVTRQTIINIEKGHHSPVVTNLKEIEKILKQKGRRDKK